MGVCCRAAINGRVLSSRNRAAITHQLIHVACAVIKRHELAVEDLERRVPVHGDTGSRMGDGRRGRPVRALSDEEAANVSSG